MQLTEVPLPPGHTKGYCRVHMSLTEFWAEAPWPQFSRAMRLLHHWKVTQSTKTVLYENSKMKLHSSLPSQAVGRSLNYASRYYKYFLHSKNCYRRYFSIATAIKQRQILLDVPSSTLPFSTALGLPEKCKSTSLKLYSSFWLIFGHCCCSLIKSSSISSSFCRDADDACHDLNGKEFMGERISVEIARGTPHGRDRERWGSGGGGGGRRDRSRSPRGGGRRGDRFSRDSRGRPVWLDKYGPPTRTDYRLTVENLSSRVSWQVSSWFCVQMHQLGSLRKCSFTVLLLVCYFSHWLWESLIFVCWSSALITILF